MGTPKRTPLAVGDEAPDFTLPLVTPEGESDPVALSDLLEDGAVLLAFYTNDFSPDCITEWCSFRDYSWFAADERLKVVGISKSGVGTHRRFIDYLNLQFPLFSDGDLSVADAFGVSYRTFGLVRRPRRSCFLIDTEGRIRYRWLAEHPLDPTRDVPNLEEVHGAIEEALGRIEMDTFAFDIEE
jgi:peroxiredoxin